MYNTSSNGALTSLNISNNNLSGVRGHVDVPANSKVGDCFGEHEVIIFKHQNPNVAKVANFSGINALADSIKDNGAMTSLSLASNYLGVAGAKIIAAVLPMCT
jgi:hypothetical protein